MTKPFPADDRTSCRLPSIPADRTRSDGRTLRSPSPTPGRSRRCAEPLHSPPSRMPSCRRTGAGQSGPQHVHPGFLHQSPVAPRRSRRKAWLRHCLPRSSRGQAPRKQENDGPWPQSLCPRSPGRPPFRSSRRTSAPYARIPSCTLARCPVLPSRSTIPVGRRR